MAAVTPPQPMAPRAQRAFPFSGSSSNHCFRGKKAHRFISSPLSCRASPRLRVLYWTPGLTGVRCCPRPLPEAPSFGGMLKALVRGNR